MFGKQPEMNTMFREFMDNQNEITQITNERIAMIREELGALADLVQGMRAALTVEQEAEVLFYAERYRKAREEHRRSIK